LLVQIYVDDIIFGSTNESLCREFARMIQGEFEMSMIGELNFFFRVTNQATQEWHLHQSIQVL